MVERKRFLGAGAVGFQPGKGREHRGSFMHEHHGRVIPKGRKREKDARYAIGGQGFTVEHRKHKVIQYKGPGFGLGRGHGRHSSGYHLSAATRAKISAALKKYYASHVVTRGPMSPATKGKISAALKRYDASHPAAVRARNAKAAITRAKKKATKRK